MKQIEENTVLRDSINGAEMVMCLSGYAVLDNTWYGNDICAPFNRLYLIESGEGFLRAGDTTVIMKPGMAYLVPTRTNFSYYCESALTKLFFHFNLLKPDKYDVFYGIEQILEVPMPAGLYETTHSAYKGNTLADGMLAREQIYKILNVFARQHCLAHDRLPTYSKYVTDTIAYILGNLSAGLHVDALAQRCYVSKSYLEKLFRKEVGVSVGQYIDDQLMRAAQEKLDQTNDSVAKIGQSLGFNDPYYFSRRFKQLCGITPLRYRRLRRLHYIRPLDL